MAQAKTNRQTVITEPFANIGALYQTAVGLKERVEVMSGQRGLVLDAAVTFRDLVELGLISPDQVPKKLI